mgnify:CR=1 FL=1
MLDLANRIRAALRTTPRRAILVLGALAVAGGVRQAIVTAQGAPCATGAEACDAPKHAGAAPAPDDEGLSGQARLVEFTSSHCSACKRMAPIVADLERRCSRAVEGAIVQVNVDEPEGEALAMRYQVRALPTFLGIDAEGAEVTRLVGLQTPERLNGALGAIRVGCPAL